MLFRLPKHSVPRISKTRRRKGEGEDEGEEETLISQINEGTKPTDLADKLFDLNRRAKLKQPLVGALGATLHVYRATADSKDITETFRTTLLPPPDKERLKGFSVTMKDIFGDSTP